MPEFKIRYTDAARVALAGRTAEFDSAHEEETEITSGPRQGEKVMLPRPDNE
jgi:hypothetical protein